MGYSSSLSRRTFVGITGLFIAPSIVPGLDTEVRFRAKSLTGEVLSNESLRGKVVLVQFWATWCPYCRSDAPAVDAILEEFRPQGLEVLAVDVAESKRTVTKFLADSPRECKIVLMTDTNLAAWFGPKVFPYYAVIDRDGKLAGERKGAGGERSLRSLLRKAGLNSEDSDDPGELRSSPRRD